MERALAPLSAPPPGPRAAGAKKKYRRVSAECYAGDQQTAKRIKFFVFT